MEAVVAAERSGGNGDRDFPHGGNGGGVKYIMRVLLTIRTMVMTVVLTSRREAGLIAACDASC